MIQRKWDSNEVQKALSLNDKNNYSFTGISINTK